MRYIVVDGNLSGTGVRDAIEGGWLTHRDLGISESLSSDISVWQRQYESAHYNGFRDSSKVANLDAEGMVLRGRLLSEVPQAKVDYFSSAVMRKLSK